MRISDWSSDVALPISTTEMCAHVSRIGARAGVVTGLASEVIVASALVGQDALSVRVVCAGASGMRAAALARDLVEEGVKALRSDERRVGKECVSTCRSLGSAHH